MSGILYGVGVGPGDPEYLTLKAVRIIGESDIVFVPNEKKEESVAYQIAKGAIPDLKEEKIIPVAMPMTKNAEVLNKNYREVADKVVEYLKNGKTVAFLTLGDPTVYSTYMYIHQLVEKDGYATEIISGVPSFCAVAAKLNISLVERSENLHVIPASYGVEEGLQLSGTKVLMKAGKKIDKVKASLRKANMEGYMIENCGMENEIIYKSVDEIKEDAGYYSLIIVKEK